ncbi:N-acetylmuramic acid 6-phosphate etherase [Halalkalibacillus sediminis]|uniref:N-acetylmuramic acid 6-phosphate etherase n=1 Tax=Halalkalibacillus sediminis TaxID=2018042 RepID=A0A2I0QV29_9BACI|nr:N-acetylmuramic acid 6-phosphate etherase [Halalkalibacillus sediminis]PKR77950.1 N-acetylmuramic acid 6-phosphate etherase [Halalkalibacillus sediminis]
MELSNLVTEQRNENSKKIDQMSTTEMLRTINQEDQKVALAVNEVLSEIEEAVDVITARLKTGGRLFYVGAGTSGRLGILDEAECPPTFMTCPDMVQTLMAGGKQAFFEAIEGSEDNETQGRLDLRSKNISNKDVVVGITASGRTPYPIGALKEAGETGAYTVSLSCNPNSFISRYARTPIEVIVGPEVLTGSTRMKAATSHKMILNMISTSTMIRLGKVFENLMVDVQASNYKLKERAKSIIMEITGVNESEALKTLSKTNNRVKPAIVMLKGGVDLGEAQKALDKNEGYVREAIEYTFQG